MDGATHRFACEAETGDFDPISRRRSKQGWETQSIFDKCNYGIRNAYCGRVLEASYLRSFVGAARNFNRAGKYNGILQSLGERGIQVDVNRDGGFRATRNDAIDGTGGIRIIKAGSGRKARRSGLKYDRGIGTSSEPSLH